MEKLIAVFPYMVMPAVVIAAEDGFKVAYGDGSVSDTKAGTALGLYVGSDRIGLTKDSIEMLNIPASTITEKSYGQDVHRSVGAAIASCFTDAA
jgi:hypothetical protein